MEKSMTLTCERKRKTYLEATDKDGIHKGMWASKTLRVIGSKNIPIGEYTVIYKLNPRGRFITIGGGCFHLHSIPEEQRIWPTSAVNCFLSRLRWPAGTRFTRTVKVVVP